MNFHETELLLSADKLLSSGVHEGQRYIHVRRYFEKNGQRIKKKEGVALYPSEWKILVQTMPEIDQSKEERHWDLSERAYVWKKPDDSVQLALRTRVWNSDGGEPLPEKTVTMRPAEWQALLSLAHQI